MYGAGTNGEAKGVVRAGWPTATGSVLLLMAVCAATSAARAQPAIYVVNVGSDDVSVLDPETNTVVAAVPVGRQPNGIAVTPDGHRVYISNLQDDTVSVLDAATRSAIGAIAVGDEPVGIAAAPDGGRVYVANRRSNTISVIDVASGRVAATFSGVGPGSNGIALTPDGARAYVNNAGSRDPGTLSVLDAASGQLVAGVEVARNPKRVAIAPDGQTAYVANFRSWNISVVEVASNTLKAALRVSGRTVGVAVHPNGQYAYITNLEGTVEILETSNNLLTAPIAVGHEPYAIALSGQGGTGYVANLADDTISVVDLGADVETTTITVGDKPFAVAWGCMGPGCDLPPFTPKPTRTATPSPTITLTPTITQTQPPTVTPTDNPNAVRLQVGATSGRPGEVVEMSVTFEAHGQPVAGVQLDVGFDTHTAIAMRANAVPDCTANPTLDKQVFGGFAPSGCTGETCEAARLLVLSLQDTTPLPDRAELFRCRISIASNAAPGVYPLSVSNVAASTPDGTQVDTVGVAGAVSVLEAAGAARLGRAARQTADVERQCSTGVSFIDGNTCGDDFDCPDGVCANAAQVCDGGADDGLLCACPGGSCEGAGSCPGGASLGTCHGGNRDGDCCDVDFACAGGRACVATVRLCAGGAAKGLPCLRDDQCTDAHCVYSRRVCAGGPFDGFSCIDDFDCPTATCRIAPTPVERTPGSIHTPQAVRTPTSGSHSGGSVSGSGGGGGCAIDAGGRRAGGCAWLLLVGLGFLACRSRRR